MKAIPTTLSGEGHHGAWGVVTFASSSTIQLKEDTKYLEVLDPEAQLPHKAMTCGRKFQYNWPGLV